MPRPKKAVPAYLLHRASGQARVRLNGRDHYLGRYGSSESKEKYARLIAEHAAIAESRTVRIPDGLPITISALIVKYHDFARAHYRRNGQPSEQLQRIQAASRPLIKLYGSLPALAFGPLKLRAVRNEIVRNGHRRTGQPLSRAYVNDLISIVRRVFKWAVAEELVPVTVYQAISTLSGLQKGRDAGVHDPLPVRPVEAENIEAVLGIVPPPIAAMIQLQQLTGMRPDEVTIMRPCDIEPAGDLWSYRPFTHKTEHFGIPRVVLLGPKAQAILKPWLDCEPTQYIFSPRAVVERQLAEKRESKKRMSRRELKRKWLRPPRDRYDDASYRRAVTRACVRAGIERWTPNQLRHTAATDIRREFGIEAAQLALGHRKISTTEIYAERDLARYADVTRQRG